MTREIIKPTTENYNLHIPKKYINQKIAISISPLPKKTKPRAKNHLNIIRQTGGILKQDIDPVKWQRDIRNEYER